MVYIFLIIIEFNLKVITKYKNETIFNFLIICNKIFYLLLNLFVILSIL
jgi:hypothetical protein